jgi:hypothetical protein
MIKKPAEIASLQLTDIPSVLAKHDLFQNV